MPQRQKVTMHGVCFAFELIAVSCKEHGELFVSFFALDRARHLDLPLKSEYWSPQ